MTWDEAKEICLQENFWMPVETYFEYDSINISKKPSFIRNLIWKTAPISAAPGTNDKPDSRQHQP